MKSSFKYYHYYVWSIDAIQVKFEVYIYIYNLIIFKIYYYLGRLSISCHTCIF